MGNQIYTASSNEVGINKNVGMSIIKNVKFVKKTEIQLQGNKIVLLRFDYQRGGLKINSMCSLR